MTHSIRPIVLVVALVLCPGLTGCSVPVQDEPVAIDVPVPNAPSTRGPVTRGPRPVTVYFVAGDRLTPAYRSADATTPDHTLELLQSGPAPEETRAGLRTAIAPSSASVAQADPARGTVMIEVTSKFTAVPGTNQLLAVAQIVWTVTEAPGTRQVRMSIDGRPLEIPTDRGLSQGPVTRDDFRTVAPPPGEDRIGEG